MKVPKHKHEKTLWHMNRYVCWCKFPYCKVISALKEIGDDITLIAVYELIRRRLAGKDEMVPLDNFIQSVVE